MAQEKTAAEFHAREAKAEAFTELLVDCLGAFLRGEAALVVTDGNQEGCRVINFQRPPAP